MFSSIEPYQICVSDSQFRWPSISAHQVRLLLATQAGDGVTTHALLIPTVCGTSWCVTYSVRYVGETERAFR
jgi:hypothetical protein